jgi:hypothetical protein
VCVSRSSPTDMSAVCVPPISNSGLCLRFFPTFLEWNPAIGLSNGTNHHIRPNVLLERQQVKVWSSKCGCLRPQCRRKCRVTFNHKRVKPESRRCPPQTCNESSIPGHDMITRAAQVEWSKGRLWALSRVILLRFQRFWKFLLN